MSTLAIYTFCENGTDKVFHVYKHHDGYPSGALDTIRNAFRFFAWTLPRFEADEAAASFVAACKADNLITFATCPDQQTRDYAKSYLPDGDMRRYAGGGVRLLHSGKWSDVAPGDIEYRYVISQPVGNKPVTIECYVVSKDWTSGEWSQALLGRCTVADLLACDDVVKFAAAFESKAEKAKLKPIAA